MQIDKIYFDVDEIPEFVLRGATETLNGIKEIENL